MKSIFDGSIQESAPFGGQSDRNFSMSQFRQFIFSSKSMMCVILSSLGLHWEHNCVISNIFTVMCLFDTCHLFCDIQSEKCVQFTYISIPTIITSLLHTQSTYIFISICVESQLKLFQLNFPLAHATAPGIVRFYFYYVYSSPSNIIVPLCLPT